MEPIIKNLVAICPKCKSKRAYRIDLDEKGRQIIECSNPDCLFSWRVKFQPLSKNEDSLLVTGVTGAKLPCNI